MPRFSRMIEMPSSGSSALIRTPAPSQVTRLRHSACKRYRTRHKYRHAHARETANDYAASSPGRLPGGVADDIRLGFNNTAAGNAFRQLPHQYLANEIAGERRRINRQLRTSERRQMVILMGQVSGHPLDPLRARRCRLEEIAEILRLAGHLPIEELHDAHHVRRLPVIGQDIFSDPKATRADNPAHCEAFPVRLCGTRR